MSTVYGGGYGSPGPSGKVNYGWIGESFRLFQTNAGIWIVAVLIAGLLPALIGFAVGFFGSMAQTQTFTPGVGSIPPPRPNPFGGMSTGLGLGVDVFSICWTAFFYGGIYKMALKQVRGEPLAFADIFSGGGTFLLFLLFNIVYGLAVGIGTVLCIVPGLLAAGLLFPAYALLADGVPLSEAISRSVDGMKQDMWNAAGFVFVMGLLLLVSALPCYLGTLVTLPMFWIIGALAYRDMIGMPGGGGGQPAYGTPQPGVWPPPPTAGQAPPQFGQPTPPPQFGASPQFGQGGGQTLSGDPLDENGNPPAGR